MELITITKQQECILNKIKGSDLESFKLPQIREFARELNISKTSTLKKQEMIDMLKNYISKHQFVVQEDLLPTKTTHEKILEIYKLGDDNKKIAFDIISFVKKNNLQDEVANEYNVYKNIICEKVQTLFTNSNFCNQKGVQRFISNLDGEAIEEKVSNSDLTELLKFTYLNCKKVNLLQKKYIGLFGLDNEIIIYYICKLLNNFNSEAICYIIEKEKND